MERADLLYSGLILAALILSLWTAVLLTAAFIFFAPFTSIPESWETRKQDRLRRARLPAQGKETRV